MRKLTRFPVQYPVTILMIVLAILLLGYISFDKLGIDLFPDLNNPKLFVELEAGERPPEEIERNFVDGIESLSIRQSGVVEVSSVSKVGAALITVEYSWDKDMDEAFLDLQKALTSYNQNTDIDELTISRQDPNAAPVLLLTMWHPTVEDMNELRQIAENYIRNELIRLEGIADVQLAGHEEKEAVIETSEYLLDSYNITPETIAGKIQNFNQNISSGSITEMGTKYIIKGVSLLNNLDDIRKIIVKYDVSTNPVTGKISGVPVLLEDVATVVFKNKDPENIVRVNQKRSLGLHIYKETNYNTVKAVDELLEKTEDLKKALPGYQFRIIENQGEFITSAIEEVEETALIGIVLAVLVLYVFLRRIGTTLVISIAIPISIIATFNLMYFNNLTLNIMTLGGLALGAGMLVDNAIIVMENIFRNMEKGASVKDAAIEGTAQVGGAITASTLTTIVVFLPIVYLHGASGELFKDQAWTVAFSLLSSLFVAILVIPVLVVKIFRKKQTKTLEEKTIRINAYGRILNNILKKKLIVILAATMLIGFTALLLPRVGSEYFPKTKTNTFTLELTLPEGTQLERTESTVKNIETIVYSLLDDDLATLYSQTGPSTTAGAGTESFYEGENTARLKVALKKEAISLTGSYIHDLDSLLANIPGLDYRFLRQVSSLQDILGTDESPVIVEVKGERLDEIERISGLVKEKMTNIEEIFNVKSSIEGGAPELEVIVDRYKAGMYNIGVETLTNLLRDKLSGTDAGELDHGGEMKDMTIKLPEPGLKAFKNSFIEHDGRNIPLEDISEIKTSLSPKKIHRRNQVRIAKVSAQYIENIAFDKVVQKLQNQLQEIQLSGDEYKIEITGEEKKRKESFGNLSFALILSIILVYMVMASQFESLIHPFTILLTIPLAGVGTVVLFYLLGNSLNVMAYIGLIMLAGIAVNDSIILVDAINQLKSGGLGRKEAIIQAGMQRIRPIIMTTVTTILALLPLTFGFGESAALRAPMALAVIGGLVTSTLLTLVVIPCVYEVFDVMKERILRTKMK